MNFPNLSEAVRHCYAARPGRISYISWSGADTVVSDTRPAFGDFIEHGPRGPRFFYARPLRPVLPAGAALN